MELLLRESQALPLLRGPLPTGRGAVVIQRRPHRSARRRRGVADQVDGHLTTHQRSPAPILGHMAAHPVLDRVPLPRPRWKVAHREAQACLIRQTWPRDLPQAAPAAIGATTIRRDEEPCGLGRDLAAHGSPPAPDRLSSQRSRVMSHPHADPARVCGCVIDAVRHDLAPWLAGAVMHPDRLRLALRRPRAPTMAERADPCFLCGIDRYDRGAWLLEGLGTTVHGLAWRLPIGVRAPLQGLPVGLEAVPQVMAQAIDRPRTHQMPLRPQGGRQLSGTFACPP